MNERNKKGMEMKLAPQGLTRTKVVYANKKKWEIVPINWIESLSNLRLLCWLALYLISIDS